MNQYRVALVPGDGIGQEVVPAGTLVCEAAAERFGFQLDWQSFPWGSDHYFRLGTMMPEDGLEVLY